MTDDASLILSIYRRVYETVDNDENYDKLFLDFSKALDRVLHPQVLRKIKSHGTVGKGLIVKSRVQVNGEKNRMGLHH